MSNHRNEIALPSDSEPQRLGQATAVEQSRAVAQVQAAATLARQFPRSETRAIAAMREACGRIELAERAFFSFPRAGQTVTGASVYLARELARIWGNLDYGLAEMARDDKHGQSEMLAHAWDLETNARTSRTFIIQHARDTKRGRQVLTELRDISDNNNNFGARAVREMVFSVLPQWFTDMAKDMCRYTLETGGGMPLPQRIDTIIAQYERGRVRLDQLEDKVGVKVDEWSHVDVTDLEILFKSLAAKEITRDEAFPPKDVTAAELVKAAPAAAVAPARSAASAKSPQSVQSPAVPEGVDPATGELSVPAIPGVEFEPNPHYDDAAWQTGGKA